MLADRSVPYAARLTKRELQVLGLLISGLTDKEIGYRLGISARCVREHISRSALHLGAHSRSHLGAIAVLLVLVDHRDTSIHARDDDPLTHAVAELVDHVRSSYFPRNRPCRSRHHEG